MDINNVYTGNSFKAEDLGDDEPVFRISSIEEREFKGNDNRITKKLVLSFLNQNKMLVCNKTNAKRIAFMFGNETDDWINKDITLYVEHVDFQGGIVPAIRVKVIKQKPAAPAHAVPPRSPVRPSSAEMQRPRRQTGGMSEDYRQDADDEIPF